MGTNSPAGPQATRDGGDGGDDRHGLLRASGDDELSASGDHDLDRRTPTHPRLTRPRLLAALAGVLAAATTLGVAQLIAAIVSPNTAPLVAVGGAFIDATPPWLKDFAVATFGTYDKLVLLIGMGLAIAALAALAGVLARRRWGLGASLIVLLGAVGAFAALTRPNAGALAPLPSIVGVGAGMIALRSLLARIPDKGAASTSAPFGATSSTTTPSRTPSPRTPGSAQVPAGALDRRSFLTAAAITAAIAAVGAAGGQLISRATRTVEAARTALTLPRAARPVAAVAAGVQSTVPGVVEYITSNADFYRIDTALLVPQVDAETWTLRVHGLVENEVELTFQDLLDADLVESRVTLTCVSNEVGGDLIGNAKWLGYPIRELLARARPQADADMVLSTSADGFTASTPLAVLTDDRDALLAIGMNDEPLPVLHGYPVRMVVPGLYGFVSATKWVVDLEVTRFADKRAYWTDRGWSAMGPIKTESRIEVPRAGAQVKAGRVAVGGTAWAQRRGISKVEIQVDDGDWAPATLSTEESIDTWRQWSYAWDATPGTHRLTVRATDPIDGPQTTDEAPPAPDGATGLHTVDVTVR